MKRKINIILLTILMFVIIAGCWSRTELNEYSIASGIAIDKSGEMYEVSVQVLEPRQYESNKSGGASSSPVSLFKAKGYSISEALRKMTKSSPRKIYLGHIRMLVIGEKTARHGINEMMDYFRRENDYRSDFDIIIAKDSTAEQALLIISPIENVPASKVYQSLDASDQYLSSTKSVKLDELIKGLSSKGQSVVLPGLKLIGDLKKGNSLDNLKTITNSADVLINGLGVFREDKLIGWLNHEDSTFFNYITDNVKKSGLVFNCPDEQQKISYAVLDSNTKVKGRVRQGVPSVEIFVRAQLNIEENACHIDLLQPRNVTVLEESVSKQVEDSIVVTIEKVKTKYQTDIFGFGKVVHRAEPKAWKALSKNWDEQFKDLQVTVKVETKIQNMGSVMNTLSKRSGKE